MGKRVLGLAAAVVVLVAACGGGTSTSSAAPAAAHACRDFNGWYQAHRSSLAAGAYSAALKQAAAQAHSAKLRLNLDRLRVADGIAAQTSGSLQVTAKKHAQALAQTIVSYCRSVSTNS
jgi:hypothetical protein